MFYHRRADPCQKDQPGGHSQPGARDDNAGEGKERFDGRDACMHNDIGPAPGARQTEGRGKKRGYCSSPGGGYRLIENQSFNFSRNDNFLLNFVMLKSFEPTYLIP